MTLFIGDVHGKYSRYKAIIRDHINTIQVGDMGVGFTHPYSDKPYGNPPHYKMLEGGHRFIRGNHDNPAACRKHTQWIKDGSIEGDIMFVGGATSIDRAYRVRGHTWWADEELSYQDLGLMADIYRSQRPRIMVTHECPSDIADLAAALSGRAFKLEDHSLTRKAFQIMLEAHQPDIWIFGHWHVSLDKQVNGTRFVCLNELETKEIEVGLI